MESLKAAVMSAAASLVQAEVARAYNAFRHWVEVVIDAKGKHALSEM